MDYKKTTLFRFHEISSSSFDSVMVQYPHLRGLVKQHNRVRLYACNYETYIDSYVAAFRGKSGIILVVKDQRLLIH